MKNFTQNILFILFLTLSAIVKSQDLISFQEGNLYGFKNTEGKIIVQPKYDWVGYRFYNGFILVQQNRKNGIMDNKGNIVVPLKYESIAIDNYAKDSIIVASLNNIHGSIKYGYIDKKGNIVIDIKYEEIGNFHNGFFKVKRNGKYGVIDRNGNLLLTYKYSSISDFCNGYALVRIIDEDVNKNKYNQIAYGYIDTLGNEFIFHYPNYKNYKNEKYEISKELYETVDLFKVDDNTKLDKDALDGIFTQTLKVFRFDPIISSDNYCDINQVCVGYGLSVQGDLFLQGAVFHSQEKIKYFKKNTIHKIISSETLRSMTWSWLSPIYKNAFQSTDSFIQRAYKSIAQYLKDYINNYDQEKVEAYLKRDEKKFARYDINGNYDSNRKLSAFVDRLIIIHKIISVDDARKWINKIADEVLTW